VSTLSGGERNRLLLARLFAKPANLLVLDEPTNDLDIESLELLEDTLADYTGTLLLVSHDRAFLDNVVTQTLVAEEDGHWQEYAGGYSDWIAQRPTASDSAAAEPARAAVPTPAPAATRKTAGSRLSFKETKELEALPARIETLEQEQSALLASMAGLKGSAMQDAARRAAEIGEELERSYSRWEALDARA
jgi:ATP-binding cassette subfamily F protein uup